MVQNNHITELFAFGYVNLQSEEDTIDLVQRLRRNKADMSLVDFDLNEFLVTYNN
jgi:hypothetical protein